MPPSIFPTINATLNLISLIFLILGRIAVKKGDVTAHWRWMTCALTTSGCFLVSYLFYHFVVGSHVVYEGAGFMRAIYLLILIPHVIIAAAQLPFILLTVWSALRQKFSLHVRLVKWVWPVWVYVSVTGVLVYLMLYIFPHG